MGQATEGARERAGQIGISSATADGCGCFQQDQGRDDNRDRLVLQARQKAMAFGVASFLRVKIGLLTKSENCLKLEA